MRTLICGSMAYDTIMVFRDRFKNHILPEKIHILNVAFLVPDMRRVTLEELEGWAGSTIAKRGQGYHRDGRVKGLRIHERDIEVDLAEFLRPPDSLTVERWFETGTVSTERGVLWLAVRLGLSDEELQTR